MKNLTRIVTFMGYPDYGTPQQMLENGSNVYTLPAKIRLFSVRKVVYDDNMTPMYAIPTPFEKPCLSLDDIIKREMNLRVFEAPILDLDNHLKVYDDEVRDN